MSATSAASLEGLAVYQRAGDGAVVRIEAAGRGLDAALGPFYARCTEYPVPGPQQLPGMLLHHAARESALVRQVGEVARAFREADSGWFGWLTPNFMRSWNHQAALGRDAPIALIRSLNDDMRGLLAPMTPLGMGGMYDAYRSASWNMAAIRLNVMTQVANQGVGAIQSRWPEATPYALAVFAAPMTLAGLNVAALSVMGDYPRWATQPIDAPDDLLHLALQGFWYESMAHVNLRLFQALSAELDQLSLTTAAGLGRTVPRERGEGAGEWMLDPATGALDVYASQAFPTSFQAGQQFQPQAVDAMRGIHSAISYEPGEQVRLERLNADRGDYRISIAGLNPNQPGALNNFEAVAMTARGMAEGNHYYEAVRANFLADLERIPPGSVLHMQGHSMGGGMCFLLRDDPVVQQHLVAAGIVVGSLTTFGAVRPQGSAGEDLTRATGDPFAHTAERHYVNSDDSLARNVGAGHVGFANVVLLENNEVSDPVAAHSSYDDPASYTGLPVDLLVLPFEVDPATYAVYAPSNPTNMYQEATQP
ncbi:MAG: hypothetical protein EI684_14805 [Candidatus Viridilinea halotolerans]|uniref:Alpha/beta hydrolase n=1 Tax=Candidatus Viridilinea halotolerans TaxID=2491704 RepID=A0A426TW42_9CHLR|nr:MAG: hypothetical protein EI684_14805 [Candidatus Viridilinea halotolerans]